MTDTKKENLREALISLINSFSPEYLDLAEAGYESLDLLVDDIEVFENETEEGNESYQEKFRHDLSPEAMNLKSMLEGGF